MSHFRILVAGMEDVGSVVDLNSSLFREDAGTRDPHTDLSWPAKHGRDHFLGLLENDDALCFLALSEENAIGYLAGYLKGPTALRPVRVAELQSMYVVSNQRNQGVGGRLVDEFLAWAWVQGADRVSVTAYAENERAVRFYERVGFESRSVTLERAL